MPLLALCAAALIAGCGSASQEAAPPATVLAFSAAQATNALAHVAALVAACTPRDGGTPGAARAAAWIRDRLATNGVPAEIDAFTADTPKGPLPYANVLATFPGQADTWIVLLSHFDTMRGVGAGFEGANDGGSSTGLLIELAAAIRRAGPLRHGVICGFMDGEECLLGYSERDGFHGSKRLARQLKARGAKVSAVILMDMVGDRDLKLTLPRNGSASLRVLALEAAEATGDRGKIGLFDGDIFDDHQAFLDCGYPAVDLIDFDYGSAPGLNNYWHTPRDTMDKLSADSLAATGRIVVEMINRLER